MTYLPRPFEMKNYFNVLVDYNSTETDKEEEISEQKRIQKILDRYESLFPESEFPELTAEEKRIVDHYRLIGFVPGAFDWEDYKLICPISGIEIKEFVLTPIGQVYDEKSLDKWQTYKSKNTDPVTRDYYTTNFKLPDFIKEKGYQTCQFTLELIELCRSISNSYRGIQRPVYYHKYGITLWNELNYSLAIKKTRFLSLVFL